MAPARALAHELIWLGRSSLRLLACAPSQAGTGRPHLGSPLIRLLRTVSCPGLLCVAAHPDRGSPCALLGRWGHAHFQLRLP